MKRKDFIKTCGLGCMGAAFGPTLLSSCSSTKILSQVPEENRIRFSKSQFLDDKGKTLRYVIVEVPDWEYPLVVYRKNEKEYQSVLLRCTHQGTELQVFGDLIACPAHGSEFSNDGLVISGPASGRLTTFQTNFDDNDVIVMLQ